MAQRYLVLTFIILAQAFADAFGFIQVEDEIESLPEFVVESRVALSEPIGVIAAPISELRYEPLVDVQARQSAEAQGDVTLRGGIFENTGFSIGAATLFDPQTGHYFSEIPIDPLMLSNPQVQTGIDNAIGGFNSSVGTIQYAWQPIREGSQITFAIGDNSFNHQQFMLNTIFSDQIMGKIVSASFALERSEGDGSEPNSQHNFNRYNFRLQISDESSQTDLFIGYQDKFFAWPFLYAPRQTHDAISNVGDTESENLKTALFLVNHRQFYGENSFIELSAYHRVHTDDYEFDKDTPGLFNPYEHRTRVTSIGLQGRHNWDPWSINYGAQLLGDSINSTTLNERSFDSRTYYKLTLLPEKTFFLENGNALTTKAGFSFDASNRDSSAVLPLLSFNLKQPLADGSNSYYIQYVETSQVPGYTALNSNPSSGLFRGNADLERERSRNIEAGLNVVRSNWRADFAVFYRMDQDLVDWTYSDANTSARTANPVDINTFGIEAVWQGNYDALDLILGYTFLNKSEDYGLANVDASFYALNFAEHRWTAAILWQLGQEWLLRSDNEFRLQKANKLRSSKDEAFLSSLSLSWNPLLYLDLTISMGIDNLFDSDFEEVPGVPGAGRHFAVSSRYAW